VGDSECPKNLIREIRKSGGRQRKKMVTINFAMLSS